jgi:hypothetical protein
MKIVNFQEFIELPPLCKEAIYEEIDLQILRKLIG